MPALVVLVVEAVRAALVPADEVAPVAPVAVVQAQVVVVLALGDAAERVAQGTAVRVLGELVVPALEARALQLSAA